MPLKDISDPAVIIFLTENYQKENRLRLNWIHKHREKIQEAATLTREPTNYYESDVVAYNMVGGLPTITRDHIVAGFNRRKTPIRDGVSVLGIKDLKFGHSIADVGLVLLKDDPKMSRPNTDLSKDPIMRPVELGITEIIYKPKPDFGRLQYLEKRTKILPENRYYFNECSNWDYGWRLKDSALRDKPIYARCWHLNRAVRNRVGPQPDPQHYKASDLPGPSKCISL